MINKIKVYSVLTILMAILYITLSSGATNWVINPTSCPSLDATNFPGQDCSPEDICGDSSGTAQCYDTSIMTSAAANATTYSTNNLADNDGGYSVNCYATADASAPFCDNSGAYTCERNETFYGSPMFRNTICIGTDSGGTFGDSERGICKTEGTDYFNCYGDINCESTASSACSAGGSNNHYNTGTCDDATAGGTCICDTGAYECDGGINDADGCEFVSGNSCGASTGTYVLDECFSSSAGNCTSSTNSDCNNDDSDSNILTCNGIDGCEITGGGSCLNSTSTAGSNGTYENSQCVSAYSGGNCTASGTLNTWLDCDDSDSDGNVLTCNVGNGCEVLNNSACTVGVLVGTISMCSGGVGNCVIDDQDIATTGLEVIWSGTNPFLWLKQLGSGPGLNITFSNDKSIIINSTGIYWDDALTLTTSDESNLNVNSSSFWDGLDTPADLENKTTVYCGNITGIDACTDSDTVFDPTNYALTNESETFNGDVFTFWSDNGFSGYPNFLIRNDNPDTVAPSLEIYKNSSSPADGDSIGGFRWSSNDEVGTKTVIAQFLGKIADVTNGDEAGIVRMLVYLDGLPVEFITLNGYRGSVVGEGEVVINEESDKISFRVESDTQDHALFVNHTTGNVNIATNLTVIAKRCLNSACDNYDYNNGTCQITVLAGVERFVIC